METLSSVLEQWIEWLEKQKKDLWIRHSGITFKRDLAVALLGVRRSGKTSQAILIAQLKTKDLLYMNFEDPFFINQDYKVFDRLIDAYVTMKGHYPKVIVFDELQNIDGWERWCRKFIDFKKAHLIITGSSAKMLSSELASALSGRALQKEIWPFSFRESLEFQSIKIKNEEEYLHYLDGYLRNGGFPGVIKLKGEAEKEDDLKQYFTDIVYKDIISRNDIRSQKQLNQVINHYFVNLSSHHSYSALKNAYGIPTDTAQLYSHYLQDAFLIFEVNRYHPNLKVQSRDSKKIYVIDTGLRNVNSSSPTDDSGKLLENAVYIELRRRKAQIFYYKNEFEVDFVICEKNRPRSLIQVTDSNLENLITYDREVNGMKDAMRQLKLKEGLILTRKRIETIKCDEGIIKMIPAYRWLLEE